MEMFVNFRILNTENFIGVSQNDIRLDYRDIFGNMFWVSFDD